MVILGAGASYDSAPDFRTGGHDRPPLADELFQPRTAFTSVLERYPACHPIVPYIRNRGKMSLEEKLEQLSAEVHPERPRQLLALRCYIRDIIAAGTGPWLREIHGITSHKTLIDQILGATQEKLFS